MLGERCQVSIKLDDKGRIALPARLRHKLKDTGINALVLTFFDGCIKAYTPSFFAERIEAPIADRDPFDLEVQLLHHAVLAEAEDCSVDGQGRVRIPIRLRDECGLDGDCVLISILDWVEIWPLDRWEKRRREAREEREQLRTGNG